MRYLLLTVFLLVGSVKLMAGNAVKDSLVRRLEIAPSAVEKIRECQNLVDISSKVSDRIPWLIRLSEFYKESAQTEYELGTLVELIINYLKIDSIATAKHYASMVAERAPESQRDRWLSLTSVIIFNSEVYLEDNGEIISEKIEHLNQINPSSGSIYKRIEYAYIMAITLYAQGNFKDAVPHAELAVELSRELDEKEGLSYKLYTMPLLGSLYVRLAQYAQSIAVIEECIEAQERYFKTYISPTRPFYNLNSFYVRHYTSLMINVRAMSDDKANYYLSQILKLSKMSADSSERYNCFLSLNNYYLWRKNWPMSLSTIDSMIDYAYGIAQYNIPSLYNLESVIYSEMGKYKEALMILRKSHRIKDSLDTKINEDKINQLQVEYGMDQLNYEKSKLEIRNGRLLATFLIVVLTVVLLVCIYFYINLRREKRMKESMRVLKMRAEESEKMKSAFINSICHEIRTPLNAIAGFSNVLAEMSAELDHDSKQEMADEIMISTDQLTALINSMIEVSNLNVSDEKLPCQPTDITAICMTEMKSYRDSNKSDLEYKTDIPSTPIVIDTNAHYLSLVIDNLIGNANKFTESGYVSLSCSIVGNKAVIAVEDSGCGIPAEFRNAVFERFMKINVYSQGSGLGLYLCRLILTRLSGIIYIDDMYENGTRVIVELPLD